MIRRRARWIFATAIGALSAVGACAQILDVEPGQLDEGAGGRGGALPEEAGASECAAIADCPATPFPECRTVACAAARCMFADAPAGTAVASQIAGDCKVIECDGHGLVRSAVADDPPDDGRECTTDACAEGVPAHTPRPAGAPCTQNGGKKCAANGDCVACLADADCPGKICLGGGCAPASCADKVKNGSETDVDCGGGCPGCGDGKACDGGGDCAGKVCTDEGCCTPAPKAATCMGKCGSMTDNCGQTVSCGGCAPPSTCSQNACVCVPDPPMTTCMGKCGPVLDKCGMTVMCLPCVLPCMDGVMDGLESDVDCGGMMCMPCGACAGCFVDSDCDGSLGLSCSFGQCGPCLADAGP